MQPNAISLILSSLAVGALVGMAVGRGKQGAPGPIGPQGPMGLMGVAGPTGKCRCEQTLASPSYRENYVEG